MLYENLQSSFGNSSPHKAYLPKALSYIDGSNLLKTYSFDFIVEDTAEFANTQQVLDVIILVLYTPGVIFYHFSDTLCPCKETDVAGQDATGNDNVKMDSH